ncbi:MAG: gamma-glutamyltransferase [Gammaproteobacteria bacterium]|nr:MAG: gamma-glutamyltransferase [Gammaproteobacteria bacterium]
MRFGKGPRLTGALAFLLLLVIRIPPAAAVPVGGHALATAHPLATAAGEEVLRAGGNAFDAAVAVTAALAVVEPYSSGLGGGGFYLLHRAADGREVMLDARERAPLAARRDMYLDEHGEVVPGLSLNGPLAAGIPGIPAALAHLARHYGRLPLARSLEPAIRLARQGFPVDEHYRRMARWRLEVLRASPDAAGIFLEDNRVPEAGWILRQPELADTLQRIADSEAEDFYRGRLARWLVAGVREAGGIWSARDLEEYRVVERAPVRGTYRGLKIVSAAPPSSGGVVLIEMLHMLEHFDLSAVDEATRVHLLVEAMRRAYRDRAQYLGDPDFVEMPLERLLSRAYAARLAAGIDPKRATPSSALPPVVPQDGAGQDTTHFSIIDAEGNRVAATLSINYPFGSGFVAPGTGVLLNDEMDDFAARPGTPNVYGLVGAEANAIAPGKRMLSSMTPTFVEGPQGLSIIGTPGGSRIITMVLLGVLGFADGLPATDIVALPRFHHQYLPDAIQLEPNALSAAVRKRLQAMGHRLAPQETPWGNMQLVIRRPDGRLEAASDPRGLGEARVLQVPAGRSQSAAPMPSSTSEASTSSGPMPVPSSVQAQP